MSTPEKRAKLYALEEKIEQGVTSAVKALAEIKRTKLYELTHETWEEYCRERWGKSAGRLRQLLVLEKVRRNVAGATYVAPTDLQARAMQALSPEAQREAWRAANEAGKPTADRIKEIADKALASLDPKEQVRRIKENETRMREQEAARIVSGGDGARDRLDRIRSLSRRLRKLTEGLGPEGEFALAKLAEFDAAIASVDLC
jgi:ribosomal protein L29